MELNQCLLTAGLIVIVIMLIKRGKPQNKAQENLNGIVHVNCHDTGSEGAPVDKFFTMLYKKYKGTENTIFLPLAIEQVNPTQCAVVGLNMTQTHNDIGVLEARNFTKTSESSWVMSDTVPIGSLPYKIRTHTQSNLATSLSNINTLPQQKRKEIIGYWANKSRTPVLL